MSYPVADSLAIIQSVKPHPFLYDRRIKSSVGEKADKWAELGAKFGLSAHQIQTRWKSMKDKYILLKRRAEAYPGTNLGNQIKFYKMAKFLTFLDDVIPPYNGLPPKNRTYKYVAMNKSWEKSHTLLVIKELEKYPLLYDKTHPYYNHCLKRMDAYRRIAEVVRRHNPDATPQMISKKIRTIRTQFSKEKRDQRLQNLKHGTPFVPKLWFYHRLKFLDEKRTYDSSNLNTAAVTTTDLTDDVSDNDFDDHFGLENSFDGETANNQADVGDEDDDDNDDNDNYDEDQEIEEFKHFDDMTSSRDSTRPFEQVELMYGDEAIEERDCFEDEVEDVFDQKGLIDTTEVNRYQTRNDLYEKCTHLLENLAKQMKPPEERGEYRTKCKNCSSPSSLLGKMIESELAKVPEHIYIDAKWKIIRILEEAQREHLKEKQQNDM